MQSKPRYSRVLPEESKKRASWIGWMLAFIGGAIIGVFLLIDMEDSTSRIGFIKGTAVFIGALAPYAEWVRSSISSLLQLMSRSYLSVKEWEQVRIRIIKAQNRLRKYTTLFIATAALCMFAPIWGEYSMVEKFLLPAATGLIGSSLWCAFALLKVRDHAGEFALIVLERAHEREEQKKASERIQLPTEAESY